ncbi:hypothetical protein CONLIGDRAFT_630613 [Coniochaeta ligniaria NRRL 30616]|uniref:Uncharacterized protein n=1 Tax=Coniochaeta ligniaria NRRL 30616 TaxID=1408157 RepID=A0A1J7JMX1_9PEZI|nr:hypothetical protein CONLIGDRAFT_630613 [Coniochaeta ligniaria NRRL 30616]
MVPVIPRFATSRQQSLRYSRQSVPRREIAKPRPLYDSDRATASHVKRMVDHREHGSNAQILLCPRPLPMYRPPWQLGLTDVRWAEAASRIIKARRARNFVRNGVHGVALTGTRAVFQRMPQVVCESSAVSTPFGRVQNKVQHVGRRPRCCSVGEIQHNLVEMTLARRRQRPCRRRAKWTLRLAVLAFPYCPSSARPDRTKLGPAVSFQPNWAL